MKIFHCHLAAAATLGRRSLTLGMAAFLALAIPAIGVAQDQTPFVDRVTGDGETTFFESIWSIQSGAIASAFDDQPEGFITPAGEEVAEIAGYFESPELHIWEWSAERVCFERAIAYEVRIEGLAPGDRVDVPILCPTPTLDDLPLGGSSPIHQIVLDVEILEDRYVLSARSDQTAYLLPGTWSEFPGSLVESGAFVLTDAVRRNYAGDLAVTIGATTQQELRIAWNGFVDFNYSVFETENLADPNWQRVFGPVSATEYIFTPSSDSKRFYRVSQE